MVNSNDEWLNEISLTPEEKNQQRAKQAKAEIADANSMKSEAEAVARVMLLTRDLNSVLDSIKLLKIKNQNLVNEATIIILAGFDFKTMKEEERKSQLRKAHGKLMQIASSIQNKELIDELNGIEENHTF